jgi:hypothetical protein
MSNGLLHDLRQIVKDHRSQCRLRGVKFPEMVVIPVEVDGGHHLEVVRRDMEPTSLRIWLYNLTQRYPSITRDSMLAALRFGFPEQLATLKNQVDASLEMQRQSKGLAVQ